MLFSSPGIDQVRDLSSVYVHVGVFAPVGAREPVACLRFIHLILLWGGRGTAKASRHINKASPVASHTTHYTAKLSER